VFRITIRTERHPSRALAALLVLSLLGALGACSTASQERAQSVNRRTAAFADQMRTCIEVAYSSSNFEPARRRLPLDFAQATLEQETDPSLAKDVEIAAVLQVHPQLQVCRKTFLDQVGVETPSLMTIHTLIMTLSESSLFDVLQKKKSWGDHVRDVKELQRRSALDIEEENKSIGGGLSQEPKAVQARREAAEKAMTVYLQVEKSFSAIRRPVFSK